MARSRKTWGVGDLAIDTRIEGAGGRAFIYLDTVMWPAAHNAYGNPVAYIAPNIDLAVHFHRAAPASEWLLCEARSPVGTGGLVSGQARVWSSDGQLLATGTSHLFCRPNPAFPGGQR